MIKGIFNRKRKNLENPTNKEEENNATSKIKEFNPVFSFFSWCSGARLYLLKQCPTDYNKFLGIGIIIFLTGIMASLSGGYAFYTVFKSIPLAIAFGTFWGIFIFFIDWYLVSSLKKQNKLHNELLMALPRIVLAVFLGIVISKPLELKLFEKEINLFIENQKTEASFDYKGMINDEFAEINQLESNNQQLYSQLLEKEKERNKLFDMTIEEAEGRSVTGRAGKGSVYNEKKAALEKIENELAEIKNNNTLQINSNLERIAALKHKRDMRLQKMDKTNDEADGFLARLSALGNLSAENRTISMVSLFIVLLFIAIESAPVFVKLISARGAYDELLEAQEFSHHFTMQKNIAQIRAQAAAMKFEKEELALKYTIALDNSQTTMDKILNAKKEVEQEKINKWKQNELARIESDLSKYSKYIENIFQGNLSKIEDSNIKKDLNIN